MSLSLSARVDEALASAFHLLALPPELAHAEPSSRPELGDFQCHAALAAARVVRRPPRAIADEIAAALRGDARFAAVEVAGPGFVNLRLADGFLAGVAATTLVDPALGVRNEGEGQLVVLDFGGPNVAKPLHVGHLRSLVLGESLRRIHGALGWRTHGDAHLGDWGLQMGMLSSAIRRTSPSLPYFTGAGPYPSEPPVTLDELERLYPEAAAASREDPARMAEARADTAALQAGDPGLLALWHTLRQLSVDAQVQDFALLDVHFDALDGESDVRDAIAPLVENLRARGVARDSDGALVIDVALPGDATEMPPLLLAKSDGAALYATTDLATLQARAQMPGLAKVIYVVDQRQALHFQQVFRAARRAGIADGVDLVHAGFGTVNGKDGKPFKTRQGGVARLRDLLDEAVERAGERVESSERVAVDERAGLAAMIGIAAVKFADLSGDRLSGYVFDAERLVAFEGKTGPYLQYAVVRMRSILEKAGAQPAEQQVGIPHATQPVERELVLACLAFGDKVSEAAHLLQPGVLAAWAYDIAQRFSKFYDRCPILREEDDAVRAHRLGICQLTLAVLQRALILLGITVPTRM
ncbi:arginine--tRNA ligase [Luteibacter aegosomaticola]|uniref:arginine--tRNA ligase n=1 Tax=Luteibacter aegosomaticola TaxID=2911538 RepID=UPI001FF8D7CB|nr:arginine--tRNA ligase [Luteibacter aegosomaticola]UPG92097.1 arginine--tRNA ligase [Luteibacter aegosomaticola]